MTPLDLRPDQANRVVDLVIDHLRRSELEAPSLNESEFAFTKRRLSGQLHSAVARLDIRGLVVAGAGSNPVRPVGLLRLSFYPDLAIFYYRSRVLAVEVKYLARGQRENAVTTALGQAFVYRCGGYPLTAVLLLDLNATMTDADIRYATKVCKSNNVEMVIRRRSGALFSQHPS